jgi:hypothetical protein
MKAENSQDQTTFVQLLAAAISEPVKIHSAYSPSTATASVISSLR